MEAEPFPGDVRRENLLLFLPTLSKKDQICRRGGKYGSACQNFDVYC